MTLDDDLPFVQAESRLFVPEDAMLVYDGPKDINDLMKDSRFISRKPAKQQQSKIMRTRPIFRQWEASFVVEFNVELVNWRRSSRPEGRAGSETGSPSTVGSRSCEAGLGRSRLVGACSG